MREKFTITQAAGRLGVSRRTLYNWLKRENESARKVHTTVEGKERIGRESWLTQRQLETLAQRYGRELDKNPTVEALQARIESHDAMIEEHEARIAALERAFSRASMPSSGPQPAIKALEGQQQDSSAMHKAMP